MKPDTPHAVLDLYAGHGFGVALRKLGVPEHAVEIWDKAIDTRLLNGLSDVAYRDVWDVDAAAFLKWDTLTGGPSCQLFSSAGTGKGRKVLPELLQAIRDGVYKSIDDIRALIEVLDPVKRDERIVHVLIPLHYIWRYRPTYVLLEQVRSVLPIWQAYGAEMEAWGYSWTADVVKMEQYGVPQTRRRAILMARRDGVPASFPAPTHSAYHERTPDKLDPGVKRWVTMREALGPVWEVDRPSPTVTGGGSQTGGAEIFGPGGRRAIHAAQQLWLGRQPKSARGADSDAARSRDHEQGRPDEVEYVMTGQNSRQAGGAHKRYQKSVDAPAPTVTGQVRSWRFAGAGATAEKTSGQRRRGFDEPAHTITGSGSAAWVAEGREADVPRPELPLDHGGRGGQVD